MTEKTYTKLESVELSETFSMGDAKVEDYKQSEQDKQSYSINLINTGTLCIERFRQGANGSWILITPICKTCNTASYDLCHDQHAWVEMFFVSCTEPSFELTIATKPDAQGNMRGAKFQITPNCAATGCSVGIR